MRNLVARAFKNKERALEIVVWYGVGSASIWLDAFPEGSELLLIDSWKSYASKPIKLGLG